MAESGAEPPLKSDLHSRIAVAAIGVPLCAVAVFAGGSLFALGLGALAAIGYREFATMFRSHGYKPGLLAASAGAAGFPVVVLYFGLPGGAMYGAGLLMTVSAVMMVRVRVADGPLLTAALTGFGMLYIGGLLSFGIPLRMDPLIGRGMEAGSAVTDRLSATLFFFYPVVITWLADTAAYFGGRRFGRRQLAPHVSPNKTIEGAIAAVVVAPLASLAYGWLALPGSWRPDSLVAVLFGVVVAGLAIIGDLIESALKRECGVKDSSNLLPGHGGILDRLDSLLWVIPGAYLFFLIF